MNHEYYVDLEVAKLLKEAGFDWEVYTYYSQRDNFKELIHAESSPCNANEYREPSHYWQAISAPTLAVAQRWLREIRHEFVGAHPIVNKWIYSILRPNFGHYYREKFNTYEEALEAGIKKCLTLILEKQQGRHSL